MTLNVMAQYIRCTRVHFQLMYNIIYIHIIYVRTVCMHNKRFIHRAYIGANVCNTKSYYGVYNTYVCVHPLCMHYIYSYSCVHVCTCVCIHVLEVAIAFSVSHSYWFTASNA